MISFLLKSVTKIDAIEVDATVSESHNGEVEVTEHPVEFGANITDHARPKAVMLTIEGIVSNTPLNRTQQRRKVNLGFSFSFETTTIADQIVGQPGVAEAAFAQLQAMRDNPQPITIATKYRTYESMVITSLVVPRNASTGDAVRFTATFKQVVIVKNRLTTGVIAKEPKAKPKVSRGKKVPDKTPEPTKKKSMAYQAVESLGLLDKLGITAPKK